jgi:hypothetical protein
MSWGKVKKYLWVDWDLRLGAIDGGKNIFVTVFSFSWRHPCVALLYSIPLGNFY